MTRNYDTTAGLPWPRISGITMEIDEAGNGTAVYVERMAVTVDGTVRYLADPETCHRIDVAASQMLAPVPLVDPATGADLGQDTSAHALYMAALALIRADQKVRDSA